ncbi:Putative HTH-type transcriptional regulator [Mycobacterium pseudokansasii]|uniref:HTH-type transcriptional regulator n=1 Tax=Mycobacterium pseudokansasii TaxID=2341080 RepID=A0A498QV16_9MYCO|nr:Putative HTH-type transcriptional regulator [Mycobacterium pseudokansasii]
MRGRIQEGTAWLDAALCDAKVHDVEVSPAVRARALADKAALEATQSIHENIDEARQALAIARELDDKALLVRALTACGGLAVYPKLRLLNWLNSWVDLGIGWFGWVVVLATR